MSRQTLTAVLLALALLTALPASAASLSWNTEVGCAPSGSGGDFASDGIYVTGYSGSNLGQVQLYYSTDTPGLYRIALTAHRGSFDGPVIGASQVVTAELPYLSSEIFLIFDFGGAPVTPGDTIAFTQDIQGVLSAGGSVYFDVGTSSCPGVFETDDTTPPLSTVRRDRVGIVITEQTPVTACTPSDTVMCIDDAPGDHRFKVTASFHTVQGGGISGTGQEIPMAPLGVTHGGMFWFFDPTNPEALLKLVDGCTVNGRWWVFLSAGTNVGYTVTVTDMLFGGGTKTYTNQDLKPAAPVQDTNALGGCV
jgi:hypothetical protein